MFQATTPTHTFYLPFEASIIDKLILTYKQDGRTVLRKTENDVIRDHQFIRLTLSQEETNFFSSRPASVQLRVKIGDKVLASRVVKMDVKASLNQEVM